MRYVLYILLIAVIFGLVALVDFLLKKLFPKEGAMKSGKVVRSDVAEVHRTGRTTQGVTFAKPDAGDEIISIARNAELDDDSEESEEDEDEEDEEKKKKKKDKKGK